MPAAALSCRTVYRPEGEPTVPDKCTHLTGEADGVNLDIMLSLDIMAILAAVEAARGDAWRSGLKHFDTGGRCMVTSVQVDGPVFFVGQDDFIVLEYDIDTWNQQEAEEPLQHPCADAVSALALLDDRKRDQMTWQCGGCDAWIYTTRQPPIGVLDCNVCGNAGVDFRHAHRNVGVDEDR